MRVSRPDKPAATEPYSATYAMRILCLLCALIPPAKVRCRVGRCASCKSFPSSEHVWASLIRSDLISCPAIPCSEVHTCFCIRGICRETVSWRGMASRHRQYGVEYMAWHNRPRVPGLVPCEVYHRFSVFGITALSAHLDHSKFMICRIGGIVILG